MLKISIAIILAVISVVNTLNNGLARTPPMGWLTWERFRCITDCENFPKDCISENLITRTADAMVNDGYKDAGYEYIIVDDCWSDFDRDINGELVGNRTRFPNGIKAVADYVHSKGLKFGIYADYGNETCGGYPGSLSYEEIDANTFASWGVDYVKLDGCNSDVYDMNAGYPTFGYFLNQTGRPMVFSCSWPVYEEFDNITPNFKLIQHYCNLWRNWDDIDDSWATVQSIMQYFGENQYQIQQHAGPGHWNDPDMLIIGNFGLSFEQSKSQMAVWAILAAPLIMSTDLDGVTQQFREILQNQDIIAINQDHLGIQGWLGDTIDSIQVWVRPISTLNSPLYSFAVAFVSQRSDGAPYSISVQLSDIELTNGAGYTKTDLYEHLEDETIYLPSTNIVVSVVPSGCVFYKFIALNN